MSEPIQRSSELNGLTEGAKKAPPPPGPRETNRAGGAASRLPKIPKTIAKTSKNVGGVGDEGMTECIKLDGMGRVVKT